MHAARPLIVIAALLAAVAIAAGAFGAHVLRDSLEPRQLDAFRTGADYQLLHAVALLVLGLLATRLPQPARLLRPAWLLLIGILLFSGSLYILVLSGIRAIGMATPLGGSLLIIAWCWIACVCWRGDRVRHRETPAS
ncbi:MAG: DUF423 domain-containing protein [Planctomycetota bacterium]